MPYTNVPEDKWPDMDRCVEEVMTKGHTKESAIAICHTSIMGKESAVATKAEWTIAYVNDLPDSAFLYIAPGGEKDDEGRTVPRTLRNFPYRDADGGVDLEHLRNAIARIPQSNAEGLDAEKKRSLQDKARAILEKENEKDTEKGRRDKELLTAKDNPYHDESGRFTEGSGGNGGSSGGGESESGDGGKASEESGRGTRGYSSPREEWKMVNRRLAAGNLKRGERRILEKRAEELAKKILGVEEEQKESGAGLWGAILRVLKQGARHSASDQSMLQDIHDKSAMLGADCPMMMMKQSDGKCRWVTFSSNAYQDSDREIVSLAALEADVDRADKEHKYGPLRWWHMGAPDPATKSAGPGLDIGDCDFNAMHGRILIESGTFRDNRVAERFKEQTGKHRVSIGFFHPVNEPDADGIYHSVYRFERSILPAGRASNPLTAMSVISKESDMASLKEKWEQFKAMLGDPDVADQVVKQAEAIQLAADAAGIASKEAAQDKTTEGATNEAQLVAQFKAMIDEALGTALDAKIAAKVNEIVSAGVAAQADKEKATAAQVGQLAIQLKAAQDAQAKVEDALKKLTGELPRGVLGGFRASEHGPEPDAAKVKDLQPKADPLDWFLAGSHTA